MTPLDVPWLEIALVLGLVGACAVSRITDPARAYRWGVGFCGAVFACTFLAWLAFFERQAPGFSLQTRLFGSQVLALDELNAPLVPAVALLHLLTAVATAQTKMRRFSFSWSLAAETIHLATLSAVDPWMLVTLLTMGTIPPYLELMNRGRPTRVYVGHMALFVVLLIVGWAAFDATSRLGPPAVWATVALMAAILMRCGAMPAHCWITDWFEHASFGNGLLYVIPLPGVYAAIRLVLPEAPDWVLHAIGVVSLVTAVYAAGMAVVQREARRFFAYLFLSHASLVLVGLQLLTELTLTGAFCLWFSVIISLGGFGLTLRAVEARFGRLALVDHHGLYEHSPALAICFLLTGLASVGFPGTLGFISTELLVDGAIVANPLVGVGVVAATMLNGIAVVRAYFLLFTGARHASMVQLGIRRRERFAVLTLAALILGGGIYSKPGVLSREKAAEALLHERQRRVGLDPHSAPTPLFPLPAAK
ncbi:MAG: proton-conducting transporter membrane subunit [Pirellulaceae bacterium]|nr:proton-conducting transporter membrane subunit [Pirellulaceae bacterium]